MKSARELLNFRGGKENDKQARPARRKLHDSPDLCPKRGGCDGPACFSELSAAGRALRLKSWDGSERKTDRQTERQRDWDTGAGLASHRATDRKSSSYCQAACLPASSHTHSVCTDTHTTGLSSYSCEEIHHTSPDPNSSITVPGQKLKNNAHTQRPLKCQDHWPLESLGFLSDFVVYKLLHHISDILDPDLHLKFIGVIRIKKQESHRSKRV